MGIDGLLAISGIQIIWCRLEVTKTFASASQLAVVEVPLLHMGDRPNGMLGSLTLALGVCHLGRINPAGPAQTLETAQTIGALAAALARCPWTRHFPQVK